MSLKSVDNQPIQAGQKSPILEAAPTFQGGGPPPLTPLPPQAAIAPSGKSLVLLFKDGTGDNSNVMSIASKDEIQTIALGGNPVGSSFTLSFGGHSTAPIPVSPVPPGEYGLFTVPTIAGHSYGIAYSSPNRFSSAGSPQVLFEVIDGGAVVASAIVSGQVPSSGIVDPGIDYPGGTAQVPWGFLAGGIVPSGPTLEVRITTSNGNFDIDALRVQDTTAGTIAYYDDGGPDFTYIGQYGGRYTDPSAYGGGTTIVNGGQLGPRYVVAGLGNVATGGTASDSGPDNAAGGEGPGQAFDGSAATKLFLSSNKGYLQYQFGGNAAHAVRAYALTAGGDNAINTGRAPKDWTFLGSNDGSTWTTLDTQTNQGDTVNGDTKTYAIANTNAYQYYRLNITANNGDPNIQLAELQLLALISGSGSVGAAAIQSALQALPSIGMGGVVVADVTPNGRNSAYQVTFAGNLAASAQTLIACGDPAVSISEVNLGGVVPTLSINGGTPAKLVDWAWGATAAYCPVAFCPLPQSAPKVQTLAAFDAPFSQSNGPWYTPPTDDPSTLSGGPTLASGPNSAAIFPFSTLAPGTYQVAVTWPTTPYSFYGATWTPSAATQFVVADSTGATLGTFTVDQTVVPPDYTANGVRWKVLGSFAIGEANPGLTVTVTTVGQVNVPFPAPQVVAIIDAVQLTRTSPDTSVVVKPGDTATISLPAGWATTQAGPVAAAVLPVAPPSTTTIMPAFVNGPKNCKVGYNIGPSAYFGNYPVHSNEAHHLPGNMGIARDANGYPTKLAASRDGGGNVITPITSSYLIHCFVNHGGEDHRQGTPVINGGRYLMTWDGDPNHQLSTYYNYATTVTELAQYRIIGPGGVGNRRVYEIRPVAGRCFSPSFSMEIHGTTPDPVDPTGNTYLCNLSNLAIYPPDPADPTGETIWGLNGATGTFTPPPKFHPDFLYKLQGMQSLRFLDVLNTNGCPVGNFSDYMPVGHVSRCDSSTSVNVAVSGIKAPAGAPYVNSQFAWVVHVTTATPHGLYTGASISLRGCGQAVFQDGTKITMDVDQGANPCGYGFVVVLDATNFLFVGGQAAGGNEVPHGPMTNTLSGGTVSTGFGTNWPLQDIVDLVAAVGATDLWFNVSATSDASVGGCVDQTAAFLAARLPAGVKVHVEYGNEVWNSGLGFRSYRWCWLQNIVAGYTTGYDYEEYYARQTDLVHRRFQAMFTAAGRPNDVVYTYATQTQYNNVAQAIVQSARAIGARMDEFAIQIYFNNGHYYYAYEPTQIALYDKMTTDHLLDYMEVSTMYGHVETNASSYLPILADAGYSATKMVAYEGSPNVLIPGAPLAQPPGPITNYFIRQDAIKRHPRFYGIMLQTLQNLEDVGLGLWNFYDLGQGTADFAWDAYEGYNQRRGTGNPAVDTINVTDPLARDQIVSETGGAWAHWASLVSSSANPVIKKGLVPGRNGRVRSIGLPRGTFKLFR